MGTSGNMVDPFPGIFSVSGQYLEEISEKKVENMDVNRGKRVKIQLQVPYLQWLVAHISIVSETNLPVEITLKSSKECHKIVFSLTSCIKITKIEAKMWNLPEKSSQI